MKAYHIVMINVTSTIGISFFVFHIDPTEIQCFVIKNPKLGMVSSIVVIVNLNIRMLSKKAYDILWDGGRREGKAV